MQAAVIQNGIVVNIIEVDSLDVFEGLVDATGAQIGDLYTPEGGFANPPAPKPVVPEIIDMRQARLALLDAGLLSKVNDGIAAIKDTAARATVQIEWEYSTTVRRASPWISSLQGDLGLTDAQVDALFIAAAKK